MFESFRSPQQRMGIMDEERRTSANLRECLRAAMERVTRKQVGALHKMQFLCRGLGIQSWSVQLMALARHRSFSRLNFPKTVDSSGADTKSV